MSNGQRADWRRLERGTDERKVWITGKYLLGLGIGFFPVLMEAASGLFACPGGSGNFTTGTCTSHLGIPPNALGGLGLILFFGGCTVFVVMLVAAIACLTVRRARQVGYGLLTMVFVGPVVAQMACSVISDATHAPLQ